ncbi:hypothetical protein [Mucilaginibacter sp. SP1R1]|uniref:hypothetical protein n=1 Tax=Mucilaginibacter sp. SP1R1 TaxID=2723091 RepID=UPI00161249CA|nr:hypothetical protein [Mucilaginibacter sp. SP1R1]MBB6150593.1 hypothetical protein [Mucilaginibacter sp. SP1R1]
MKTQAIAIFTVLVIVFGLGNKTQAAVNNNNNAGIVLTTSAISTKLKFMAMFNYTYQAVPKTR